MFKDIKNLINANQQVAELSKSLAEMTTDRDNTLAKLKEFETKNKDFIESAQTAEQMKATHTAALEQVKKDFETKLAEKDKELNTIKESHKAELDAIKATSEKQISTVKESVAAETIAIVASQGTDIAVASVTPKEGTSEKTKHAGVKYKSISWLNKK